MFDRVLNTFLGLIYTAAYFSIKKMRKYRIFFYFNYKTPLIDFTKEYKSKTLYDEEGKLN